MLRPMSELLLVDRRADGIVVLTLNDPDRRNAMSDAMTEVWREVIADLRADADLRCVVVTGAGRAFSSGGDLDWIAGRGEFEVPVLRDHMLGYYRTWLSI